MQAARVGKIPRNNQKLNIKPAKNARIYKAIIKTKQIVQGRNIDTVGCPVVIPVLLNLY